MLAAIQSAKARDKTPIGSQGGIAFGLLTVLSHCSSAGGGAGNSNISQDAVGPASLSA
jgi:hypothetical protein